MKTRLGKNTVTLKKSNRLIGLKMLKSRSTGESLMPITIDKKQRKFNQLGGFEIFDIGEEKDTDLELDSIRKADEVEVGTHVYLVKGSETPFVPNGYIYITFSEGVDEEEQVIVLEEFKLKLDAQRTSNIVCAVVTAESMNPVKVAFFLEKISLVEKAYADMDTILDEYELPAPNDSLFRFQWQLKATEPIIDNIGQINEISPDAHLRVVDAWNRLGNKGSSNITIAISDDGFDLNHQDLKDNIVHGFDVWYNVPFFKPHRGYTHATPCAGLALARENDSGIIGVAPNSKFMPLAGKSFAVKDNENMYNHCIENGADIVSCSWGSIKKKHELTSHHEDLIRNAATNGRNGKGCVILYAAGNEYDEVINVFGRHPDVICVGAISSKGRHASYSNRGFELDVVAPGGGGGFLSLFAPGASWESWDGTEIAHGYKEFNGTSAATPLVAGVCALILSGNPNLTAKEVKDILISTADKIGHPSNYVNGHSRRYGYGRVNADKAVAEAIRRLDAGGQTDIENNVGSGKGFFRFSATAQPSRGFGIQIGAFAEYGNVLIQVSKLQNLFGQQPIMVNINESGGKTAYKISLGQFTMKADAVDMLIKMREENVDGFIVNYENFA